MPRGGPRPGAGRKVGQTDRLAAGDVRFKFGKLIDERTNFFLNHRDPKIRLRAWEAMLPYNYQRQPQVVENIGATEVKEVRITIVAPHTGIAPELLQLPSNGNGNGHKPIEQGNA